MIALPEYDDYADKQRQQMALDERYDHIERYHQPEDYLQLVKHNGTPPPFELIIDTREKKPYTFEGYNTPMRTKTLAQGDYSCEGVDYWIERKSLLDAIHSVTQERDRFYRELELLSGMGAIVIEATIPDILNQRLTRANGNAVYQSYLSIQVKYNIPVVFASNRKYAEMTVYDLLRHKWRSLYERTK